MLQNSLWSATHCVIFNLTRASWVNHGLMSGLSFGCKAKFSIKRPQTRHHLTATRRLRPPAAAKSAEMTLRTACFLWTLTFLHELCLLGFSFVSPARRATNTKVHVVLADREFHVTQRRSAVNLWDCQNRAVCSRPYLSSPAGLLTVKMWQDQWRDMSR